MATKAWESIIPTQERKWLNSEEPEVLRQCLVDLGYLPWKKEGTIKEALLAFRKDSLHEKLLSAYEAKSQSRKASLQEEQLLKSLVALEGDFPVFQLPAQGSLTLTVRLLHYRLHLFGLYPLEKVGEAFSPQSLKALHQLGKHLNLAPESPELLKLTGHFLPLLHHIKEKGALDKTVVVFNFSAATLPKDLQKEVKEERGIKEKSKQLLKDEKACDKELADWENKILDKEWVERKRIENRNQNKYRKSQRVKFLLRKTHLHFKKQYQLRLDAQEAGKQQIGQQKALLQEKKLLLADMETTLAQANTWPLERAERRAKKKTLEKQIKARKAILKSEQKTLADLEKALEKLRQKNEKENTKQQEDLQKLQKQLKALQSKINGLRFRFKGQLKRSLQEDFYLQIKKNIFAKEDQTALKSISETSYNLFLIRVIQIHQWTNAYYNGRLDSVFAGKTFTAIAEMSEDLSQLRLKYILAALGSKNKGYWLLNIHYLLDRFCQVHPLDSEAPDYEKIMAEYRQELPTEESRIDHKTAKKIWKKKQTPLSLSSEEQLLPRRTYHGHQSLLFSFGRVIGRIGKIIWKGLKASFQILKNFVRMLYEDLRESIVLFAQSLGFLFGKRRSLPMGEGDLWDTPKYEYQDFLSVEENAKAAELHFQKESKNSNLPAKSIDRTLKILRQVATFAIALATGGITWPALLTKLILFCRRWFFRWLKEVLLERRRELFAT